MPSERENLVRDIDGLKDSIQLAWFDMISKPMAAGERQELRKSVESLVMELDIVCGRRWISYRKPRRSFALDHLAMSTSVSPAISPINRVHCKQLAPINRGDMASP